MIILKKIVSAYKKAYSGLPGEIWVIALIRLVNTSGSMVFAFLALYLTQKMGFSPIQSGKVISVYGIGALIGSWVGGKLIDRVGVFRVQPVSLGISGMLFIVMGYLPSPLLITAAMFLQGIAIAAFGPANSTTVSLVCPPEQRTRGYALNRLAVNAGVTIGPALGGVLALIDYTFLFWVDGLTCLAGSFIFVLYFKSRRSLLRVSPGPKHSTAAVKSPLKDPGFLKILFLSFLAAVIFNQLLTTFPLYFRTVYGFKEGRLGLLLAVNSVIVILFEMLLLDRLKNWPPARIIALGALFFGGGFALLPLGRGFLYAGLALIVWTVGEMMLLPTLNTLVAAHAAESVRGSYMGLYQMAFFLGMVAGPAAGMWIYETAGPDIVWAVIGILGIVLWLGFSTFQGGRGPLPGVEDRPD